MSRSSSFSWATLGKSRHPNNTKSQRRHTSDAVPSTTKYAVQGGQAFTEALKDVSKLIPFPFLSQFVEVAIRVLEVCEEVTTVEKNVQDLEERIYRLTLVAVNAVPVSQNSSVELQSRIQQLHILFSNIMADLNDIKEQKKLLLVFFRSVNKEAVGRCSDRLNEALEQFNVASQLRIEDLLPKIKLDYSSIVAQLNRIEEAVSKEHHHAPTAVRRQDMPPPQRIFLGREPLVKEIASHLTSKSTFHVCITGVGGMGKTSLALAVVNTPAIKEVFPKEYIFWIPCIEANSADLFRRILYTQLHITAQSYDSLDPLITELDSSKERRLLLLDNFETPWFSDSIPDRAQVRDILTRLAALPHIALLVTMTSGFAPGTVDIDWHHQSLQALDPVSARDTFKVNYRHATDVDGPQLDTLLDESQIDQLLTSIGRIPLAITLLAVGGGRLQSSPENLLQEWRKAGTAMISVDATRMDYTISLSVERAIRLNPEAAPLLAVLSMLPAGTTSHNLVWWAPNITHIPTVMALRTAALIEQDSRAFTSSRIFVRPTIQAYMSRNNRISRNVQDQVHTACYEFILNHHSIPDDAKFKDDLRALASEETNIQGLLMQIDSQNIREHAVDALIAFAFYQSWTKPSTVIAEHALAIATAFQKTSEAAGLDLKALDIAARGVARAHQCLGRTFFRLDCYEEAVPHFEEARCRFKALPGGADLISSGQCSMELAETWMYVGSAEEVALASLFEEANTDLSHDASNGYSVAQGLLGLGYFLWWNKDRPDAIQSLSQAKKIFEQLGAGQSNFFSIAQCLRYIARSYAQLNEHNTALAIMKEALANAKQAGDILLLSDVSREASIYSIILKSHNEAFNMIEQSVSFARAVGSPLTIAQSLELLAYNSAAQMDLKGTQIAYDKARTQYATINETIYGRGGEQRCSDNLEKLMLTTEMDQGVFVMLEEPYPMY